MKNLNIMEYLQYQDATKSHLFNFDQMTPQQMHDQVRHLQTQLAHVVRFIMLTGATVRVGSEEDPAKDAA